MMSFKGSLVLVFFALAFMLTNGVESPAELYWKLMLGNITMPKVLKASVRLGSNDNDGIVTLDSQLQVDKDNEPKGEDNTYFWINYAHPTNGKVPNNGQVIYFTDEKLSIKGTKMKLLFKQIHNGAKFLPLHYTQSMDFATNKLQVILNNLSVKPNSVAAKYIERMLDYCGQKGVKDEVRYCATSLEAIVDFVTLNSNSGKNNYMVVSTEEEKDVLLEYTIQEATKVGNDDQHNLVCHKVNNPYVVFLCHNLRSTDVYSVSLVDAKGKQMNAIAVCHKDTSDWYPKHIAFQILKVKPGNKHICHFLSGDTIVWHRK